MEKGEIIPFKSFGVWRKLDRSKHSQHHHTNVNCVIADTLLHCMSFLDSSVAQPHSHRLIWRVYILHYKAIQWSTKRKQGHLHTSTVYHSVVTERPPSISRLVRVSAEALVIALQCVKKSFTKRDFKEGRSHQVCREGISGVRYVIMKMPYWYQCEKIRQQRQGIHLLPRSGVLTEW